MTFVNPRKDFWSGKRVLLTGHTGFKGAWLALWLSRLGASVTGLSDGAIEGKSLYKICKDRGLDDEVFLDIRDETQTQRAIVDLKPDIILHLAAQSLVRVSYTLPIDTLATNVMGTAHILNAVRNVPECQAVVCVTSDKCYQNREWDWPYRENDPMGGHDPYSGSKGAAEIVISSFRESYFQQSGARIGSVRAGNVIGGGDWAQDRLVPDCLKGFEQGNSVEIRNPKATRPWQHVLEPLCGYLLLAEKLASEKSGFDQGWNFGPSVDDVLPVEDIVNKLIELWGGDAKWHLAEGAQPHEAQSLNVDSAMAHQRLNWSPRLSVKDALAWSVEWNKRHSKGEVAEEICLEQIERYAGSSIKA